MRLFYLTMLSLLAMIVAMAAFASPITLTDEAPSEKPYVLVAAPNLCRCTEIHVSETGDDPVVLSHANGFTANVESDFVLWLAHWSCGSHGPDHANNVDPCVSLGAAL